MPLLSRNSRGSEARLKDGYAITKKRGRVTRRPTPRSRDANDLRLMQRAALLNEIMLAIA
jgi:hypothetical protein